MRARHENGDATPGCERAGSLAGRPAALALGLLSALGTGPAAAAEATPELPRFAVRFEGGNVVVFNEGAEILLGYQAEEVVGRHVSLLYGGEAGANEVTREMRKRGEKV